jgi:hypothetical protein
MTDQDLTLSGLGALIGANPPKGDEIGYFHAVLCLLGLPRKAQLGREFERNYGEASLKVFAGEIWDGKRWIKQPLPYGPKPRLMLADLIRYAVVHKTQVVPLEENITTYVEKRLGLTANGGKNGPLTLFYRQVPALAAASIKLGINYGGRPRTYSGQPFDEVELWPPGSDPRQRPLWPAAVTLSTRFYEAIRDAAVPIDMRALLGLSHSSLAMDVYLWLAHRLHRVRGHGEIIHWQPIFGQFGRGDYADPKDFRKTFLIALKQAKAVYPDARVDVIEGGLCLRSSNPPVKKVRFAVTTTPPPRTGE